MSGLLKSRVNLTDSLSLPCWVTFLGNGGENDDADGEITTNDSLKYCDKEAVNSRITTVRYLFFLLLPLSTTTVQNKARKQQQQLECVVCSSRQDKWENEMMEEQVNVAAIAAAVKPLIAKLEEKPAKKH